MEARGCQAVASQRAPSQKATEAERGARRGVHAVAPGYKDDTMEAWTPPMLNPLMPALQPNLVYLCLMWPHIHWNWLYIRNLKCLCYCTDKMNHLVPVEVLLPEENKLGRLCQSRFSCRPVSIDLYAYPKLLQFCHTNSVSCQYHN